MTSPKSKQVEVLAVQRRRRWTAAEKLAMVRETHEAGMSVSLVARKHGVNPNQIFHWRKLERDGALTAVGAGEAVVPPRNWMQRATRSASCSACWARRRWRTKS
ncbi:hypothetical protein FBR04_21360 [Betaproteobacteria bacterium PRO7]|nr:hypothetical protein [Betaproteobacteria bacterium PRO7]GIL04944.1 MAG: hypothetical protein BroJett031_14640 [Betaproteobacteria bacterium]